MTKKAFLQYLTEAVEAIDERNIEALFPHSDQPDLYTLLEAMTGLRGEMKKIAQSSLRLQNEVQHLVEKQQLILEESENKEKAAENRPVPTAAKDSKTEQNLRYILRELIKLEAVVKKTTNGLEYLPEPKMFNLNVYRTKFSAWEEGYHIFERQWNALLKSTGMYQTGKVGTQFNPELHEAVATGRDLERTENTILETEQIGWLYKTKVIQQAKVVVNKIS